jgi:hypothetical protein
MSSVDTAGLFSAEAPGFLSGWFGGPSGVISTGNSGPSSSESMEVPKLRAIKTPHDDPMSPISHPELSFTPSDIG